MEPLNPALLPHRGVPADFTPNLQAFHVVFALLMEMPYVRYRIAQSPGGRN